MTRHAARWLDVYPSERKAFLRIVLLFFFLYFVIGLFRVYVEASFLKRCGPENIPVMLLVNGVVSVFFFHLCRRLGRRFTDANLLVGFLLLVSLVQGGLYWGARIGSQAVYPVLFQILYLKDAFLLVYLWNLAQAEFDVRQGRRLFVLIMGFQVLGGTLGSLAAAPLASAVGLDPILLLCSAAEMLLVLLLVFLGFGAPGKGQGPAKATVDPVPSGVLAAAAKYPILRFLAVCALIPNMLLPILTYQFGILAAGAFPTEQDLAAFLSWFRAGTTLFVFVVILAFGRSSNRMSPRTAAIVPAVNQCLVFGGIAGFFHIASAAYGQLSMILFQRTLLGPVTKQLCALLPDDLTRWAQVYVRGTLTQAGTLAGALLMLLMKPVLTPREMAGVAFALALLWSVEAFVFRRRYREGLKQVMVQEGLDYDLFSDMAAGRIDAVGSTAPAIDPEEYPEEVLTLMEELDVPWIEPEEALGQLGDPDERVRARAALSFALSRDVRAVNRLMELLKDVDAVRRSAWDALSRYGPGILPVFEESLPVCSVRVQRQLLEMVRLNRWQGLDAKPFLGKIVMGIYNDLIAAGVMETVPEMDSVAPLCRHLRERIGENLNLAFLTLWITHADMRLAYWAIHAMKASVAAELLEATLDDTEAGWILPLIDPLPEEEKIIRGRRLFPLIRGDSPGRVLAALCRDEDPVTSVLALSFIGRLFPEGPFYPLAERRSEDEDPDVREASNYCMKRCLGQEAAMPSIIQRVKILSGFDLFTGMGIRELRAVASISRETEFPPGAIVVERGKPLGGVYLVAAGRIVRRDVRGEAVDVIIEGGSFGETALFTEQETLHDYAALEASRLLIVRTEHFVEIIKLYPLVGLNLCRYFSRRLMDAETALPREPVG